MVEGEGVLQPVGRDMAVRPEAADVVEQDVQARVRGQHLAGQPPHLGLRGHVGDEDVDRAAARLAGDLGGRALRPPQVATGDPTRAPIEARRIAVARPMPPVPPVINTVLPVIGAVAAM